MSAVARIIEDTREAPRMKGLKAASVVAAIHKGIAEGNFGIISCAMGAKAASGSEYALTIQMQDRWRVLDTKAGMATDFVPENRASGTDLMRAGMMASVRESLIVEEHQRQMLMDGQEQAGATSQGHQATHMSM